jgi:hypothetical protein
MLLFHFWVPIKAAVVYASLAFDAETSAKDNASARFSCVLETYQSNAVDKNCPSIAMFWHFEKSSCARRMTEVYSAVKTKAFPEDAPRPT